MRLLIVAGLSACLMPILASAGHAQTPSDPQSYCVNRSAEFYPYTGEPCKSGYQLGPGNCRKTDGSIVAVPREQCVAMAGGGRLRRVPKLQRDEAIQSPCLNGGEAAQAAKPGEGSTPGC